MLGRDPGPFSLTPLGAGGNNRTYRLQTEGGSFFLKSYFHHPDDPRDRLGAEWAFSRFAWDHGLHQVAQPLAWLPEEHLALYEFLPGRKLSPSEIGLAYMEQVRDFLLELNRFRPEAAALGSASESCFSGQEHRQRVEGRLERLASALAAASPGSLEEEARDLVASLQDRFHRLPAVLEDPEEPWLSPSDAGFHNILEHEGRLRFFDFEYAGWDDPAKLVCDFFCAPAIPAPLEWFDWLGGALGCQARCRVLLPYYRLKWACIMLNGFLRVDGSRREFAGKREDLRGQLERVRRLFH